MTKAPNQIEIVGLLAKNAGQTWALRTEAMEVLLSALHVKGENEWIGSELPEPELRIEGDTAVIPLHGVITPENPGLLGALLGMGHGLGVFQQQLHEAVEREDVSRIVLDVNSPGGLVGQVPETAAQIRDARGSKPITAVANTTAASAAYWLASQADEFAVTPSGEVGSIGVYMLHTDTSEALAAHGVDVTLTSAGRFKTEGNQFEPLSPAAAAARQSKVDSMYEMFVEDVAQGRDASTRKVRNSYGEGRALLSGEALAEGLVDRVATLEEVVHGAPVATPDLQPVRVQASQKRQRMAALMFPAEDAYRLD